MVNFTHATTGQVIYIRDSLDVKVVLQGPLAKGGSDLVWIAVTGLAATFPVKEDLQTVLGLAQMNDNSNNKEKV